MKTFYLIWILFFLFAINCSSDNVSNLYPKEELNTPISTTANSLDTLEETPLPEESAEIVVDTIAINR
jgi:hypothetical protein